MGGLLLAAVVVENAHLSPPFSPRPVAPWGSCSVIYRWIVFFRESSLRVQRHAFRRDHLRFADGIVV